MFQVNEDNSIYVTRGDTVFLKVTANKDGNVYTFAAGEVLRIKIYGKKNCENVVLQKDFPVTSATQEVELILEEAETKIGGIINKPTDYWYEVELNPFDFPQTIIGYGEDGPALFRLFPEGRDIDGEELTPEDIPYVEDDFDMTSTRPVQNGVIARAFANLEAKVESAIASARDRAVTPEMFGAVGDGKTDDSKAIQSALSSGATVMLSAKTYLCKNIITKGVTDITMIGKSGTVIKWDITTTSGLRSQASMISDDDYMTTPYKRGGSVYLENITFDGNGSNIAAFPVTDAFALCAFYARDNVTVKNCRFKNCHCDGLMVRGLRKSLNVQDCSFDSLGLYQSAEGTRNGITVTREYWDRETASVDNVSSPLHVIIENCSFANIADECCRADGITNLSMRNCYFNKIGQHVLETGHLSDTTEYMHEIVNCVGDKITSSVYNCGADGGGAFPFRGKVTVMSCEFKSMAWTGSTAKLARTPRAALIEGFTTGYKPEVYLENCRFSSGITEEYLSYESAGYFICGEDVVIRNCYFNYAHINTAQVFPCFSSLVMEHCFFYLPSIASSYYTRMGQNNGRVRYIGCVFSHEKVYNQVVCACTGASIIFDKCRFNCEGYCLVMLNTATNNEVRFTDNTFHKVMTGRLIHSGTEGASARTIYMVGNDFPDSFCGWGTLSNVTARFDKSAYNSLLND